MTLREMDVVELGKLAKQALLNGTAQKEASLPCPRRKCGGLFGWVLRVGSERVLLIHGGAERRVRERTELAQDAAQRHKDQSSDDALADGARDFHYRLREHYTALAAEVGAGPTVPTWATVIPDLGSNRHERTGMHVVCPRCGATRQVWVDDKARVTVGGGVDTEHGGTVDGTTQSQRDGR